MSKNSRHKPTTFILASASPRRKELLQYFGFPFIVRPSNVSEEVEESLSPSEYVQTLALRKSIAVSRDTSKSIILGADTVVVHEGNIIEKPKNIDHARSMLRTLSGSTHQVMTGVALTQTNVNEETIKESTFCESTQVTFGDIHDELIENYISNGSPLDKAGGYGIQDKWGAIFTKKIEGDFYNVMGLPVHKLYQELKIFAPELL